MNCFEKVRTPERHDPLKKEIGITAGVLLLGVCLGAFSKFLDYRQAELPPFLRFDRSNVGSSQFSWNVCPVGRSGRLPFHQKQQRLPGRAACLCVFCRNGDQLLSILQLCGRFLSEKLCDDMGCIYASFPCFGVFLLVCNGERVVCVCSFRRHFGVFDPLYARLRHVVC